MSSGPLSACVVVVTLLPAGAAFAQRLPVTFYGAANGLPHDRVTCIVSDSRGFLWFCTPAGLSRFDGERFVNYGSAHGLSHPSVNHIIEARDGTYWVATNGGGVCRLTPTARRDGLFACLPVGDGFANRINALLMDRRDCLWAGTDAGVFHLDTRDAAKGFTADASGGPRTNVWTIAEDAAGDVWVGGIEGLARYSAGAYVRTYQVDPVRRSTVWDLMVDRESRLWIAHESGVLVARPPPVRPGEGNPSLWRSLTDNHAATKGELILPKAAGQARRLSAGDGLTLRRPGAFLEAADGHVWIGSEIWAPAGQGLIEFDGHGLRAYTAAHGIGEDPIVAIAEDRGRNLWMATAAGGVMRIARGGLVAYGERDGVSPGRVLTILNGAGREFYVVTSGPWIHRYDGSRFVAVRPNLGTREPGGFFQTPLVDRRGEWWIPTPQGLYRFARPARLEDLGRARPVAIYGSKDGLPGGEVLRPFEDSRGDLWFGVSGSDGVVRWERATQTFHVYGERDGLGRAGAPLAFCEDRAGNLWMGFEQSAVARRRKGRFEVFQNDAGVPWGPITTLHLDRAGRLWIGSRDAALAYRSASTGTQSGGGTHPGEAELARVDTPDAARPQFELYPPDLLGGLGVRGIAEDGADLYIGGDQGVQQFDPSTGRIRRYTQADGLPGPDVEAAFSDADGRLWFGTWRGVARLVPAAGPPAARAAVLIGQLDVRGVPYPIPELGQASIEGLELGPNQNQLEIGFFALAFSAGGPPRYQYRLEGMDADWGPVDEERRVTYASLSPGSYRFLVRAVAADGAVTDPAAVAFVILRPLWQRPWFIALAALGMGLVATVLHRIRVSRVVAVERMRTRIATDLHDDIGSSLSQIAILSEVIRQRHPDDSALADPLGRIAATSRELIDSMSDIVWAINPARDSLADLAQRMRRFASDALAPRGIAFTLRTPDTTPIRLGADVRRQVFLVFKEALNNLARHSEAAHASIELSVADACLTLQIIDDGRGFDLESAVHGHGLASMRARAKTIGALEIVAEAGRGTRVRLTVPLDQGAWRVGRRARLRP